MAKANERTALITGGMGGLGTAMARALADAGHRVLVTHAAADGDAAAWLQAQANAGYSFTAYDVDVADFDACQRMAAKIHADGHTVDILVNNAGVTRDVTFRKMTKEQWDQVLRTDLDAVFNVTKPFCEDMVARGWGRIVNISSVNGSKGQFGQTNYAAAKAGIHGFTKSLALELARKGITVNTVSPGYTETRMVTSMPKAVLDQIVAQVPIGRLGRPEEIAALVAFICSDAAAFMTGSNVAMNGGLHMY